MTWIRRCAAPLWLAFLVMPAQGWGLFRGRPLDTVAALALAAVCWLWWTRRSLPFGWLAIVAIAAKAGVGLLAPAPHGFDARYYANAEFAGAPEVGTEPAGRGLTRTDASLRFGGPKNPDLPLYFFNDNGRFNFYRPGEPQRETLPVSAIWDGWLRVTRTGLHRLYVRADGARVTLSIGDEFKTEIPAPATDWVAYPTLTAGLRPIRVTLSIPQGGGRLFEAGWTVDGEEIPFDASAVFRKPVTGAARAASSLIHAVTLAFDLAVCAWLAGTVLGGLAGACRRLVRRQRTIADALAVLWAAVIVDAWLFARPAVHKMMTLSGGDDWLSYETMARDIGLHGLWMASGAALGHGHPFYYQPFYPYFVAATHWLFGDGLYGLFLLQRVLIDGTAIALWRMSSLLFGERVAAAGFLAAGVVIYQKIMPWSGIGLSEVLFVPLVCFWALWLVRIATGAAPTLWSAAGAGLIGGIATLTRSTLILGWLPALPLVALALTRTRRAGRTAGLLGVLALVLVSVTSLATIRNWVVAHELVFVSSSGPINLLIGNEPPKTIVVPPAHRRAYERLGIVPDVQQVLEYAQQLPGPFFDGWRKKAAYTLGSFATLAPERGRSPFYMLFAFVGLLGVFVVISRRPWVHGRGPVLFIPLALALAHFSAVVVIFPTVYGDRLFLPFYALVAPYVGVAIFAAGRGARRIVQRKALLLACGLPVIVMAGLSLPGCARPPAGDVKLAKATIAKAVAAGAADYAPQELREARGAQRALDRELAGQQGRWFKSYDRARDLAIAVQAAADKAASQAAAGREQAFVQAKTDTRPAAGPNLFQNGDFALGLQGWSKHPESDATVSVDAGSPDGHAWHVQYRKGNWSTIYQEFPLQPDTIYVYEAMVKSTAPVVALYWQAETGRYYEIDKTYPEWTYLRYVFLTPHWNGQPYRAGFNPVLMKAPGEAWLKVLRLVAFRPAG